VEAAGLRVNWPYSPLANGTTFSLDAYMRRLHDRYGPEAFADDASEARREMTRDDPFLFWVLYGWHHLVRKGDTEPTFADCHFEWARMARTWTTPITVPRDGRDAILAPRETGKSTIWFTLNVLWASAHGHIRYVAAFSDSATQAEGHLATFKDELEHNELLRTDYPDLCKPKTRGRGTTTADRQAMYQSTSGFTFTARGADSANLGAKAGKDRPDLIVLDDIEPGEANYSAKQAAKRLSTVQNVILPLSELARAVLVGTVTMSGSVMDQCARSALGQDTADWISEQKFRIHYHDPTPAGADGARRSIWPSKWPLPYLESIEHTVSYMMNFRNRPMRRDGTWWRPGDIKVPDEGRIALRTVLAIDPAVTTKGTSDFTGFAVVSQGAATDLSGARVKQNSFEHAAFDTAVSMGAINQQRPARQAAVHYATGRKIPHGEPMRRFVLDIIKAHPAVSEIVIETNQGGDLHEVALHGMPVPIRTEHTSVNKEVRFAALLQRCQVGEVAFDGDTQEFEDQALAYPNVVNDDVIDAVAQGVEALTPKPVGITDVGGYSW